jgi:hypothetical protein
MRAGRDAGLVEEIDDLARQALELVVEVVGEEVDALVRALDAAAHLGEMRGLLVPELVELRADLAQEFLKLLLERRLALEVVDDLEEDQQDRADGRGIDEPGGEMRGVGRREFLGEESEIVMREKSRQREGKGAEIDSACGEINLVDLRANLRGSRGCP